MNQKVKYKRRELFVIFITIVVGIVLGWYGLALSQRVIDIEYQWAEYENKTSSKISALAQIKDHFGYGGFIHNFKNYILRKDSVLVKQLKNDLRDTYQAISDFPVDEDKVETDAVSAIKKVVDQYAVKFELAQKMVAENRSVNVIDRNVRVDDRPAIEAFRLLSRHVLQHSREQVLETNTAMENTLIFLSWGLLILPLLVITAIIIIMNIRYSMHINQELEETTGYMKELFDEAPDAMLIVDQKGNIQQVNSKATELLGYQSKQLISMKVEDLIPDHFRQTHVHQREQSFDNPKHLRLDRQADFVALKQDQSEVPVDISIGYTKKNDEFQAITTLRDVSERKKFETTLKHNENMLKKAQSIAHIGSWEWDIESNKLIWSDEIYRIFGLDAVQFGASYDRFVSSIHPDDREAVVTAVNETVVYDKAYNIEHRIVRPNGEVRFVHERGDVYRNKDGQPQSMIGTILDITEQKLADIELKLADNVFNYTDEAIIVTNREKKILRVNTAFNHITGFNKEEVLGKRPEEVISSGEHDHAFYQEMWQSIDATGRWSGEIINRKKNGELFPSWQNICAITDDYGEVIQYTSIFSDITEKKQAEERIQNLAQFDQLTQLPNRMLFNDRLARAISRSKRSKGMMGLMFIDLDGFKAVNDSLGHQAGDLLLQKVAQKLLSSVRDEDTVARLGGDEFTIILENLSHTEDAALVANKVLKALSEKIQLGEGDAQIGASIGISLLSDDGIDSEMIIKRADLAMYQAKKNGKHQYQYYSAEMEL